MYCVISWLLVLTFALSLSFTLIHLYRSPLCAPIRPNWKKSCKIAIWVSVRSLMISWQRHQIIPPPIHIPINLKVTYSSGHRKDLKHGIVVGSICAIINYCIENVRIMTFQRWWRKTYEFARYDRSTIRTDDFALKLYRQQSKCNSIQGGIEFIYIYSNRLSWLFRL